MIRFLIFFITIFSFHVHGEEFQNIVSSTNFQYSKADLILAENLITLYKVTDKGYINKDLVKKTLSTTKKNSKFSSFVPWLNSLVQIEEQKKSDKILTQCGDLKKSKALPRIERILTKQAARICRLNALQLISESIIEKKKINDDQLNFIKNNFASFLKGKNKEDFSTFLGRIKKHTDIIQNISNEITLYSLKKGIVPVDSVLALMNIDEKLTAHIQTVGYEQEKIKNAYTTEFSKLIERAYRLLDQPGNEDKILAHINSTYTFLNENYNRLTYEAALTRYNDLMKAVYRYGMIREAREKFEQIAEKNIKDLSHDARFYALWTFVDQGQIDLAKKYLESKNLISNFERIDDSRLRFWIAEVLLLNGQTSKARHFFEEIILDYPLSFYGIMAHKKVTQLYPQSATLKIYEDLKRDNTPALNLKDFNSDLTASLIRLKIWSKLDAKKFMSAEVERITKYSSRELRDTNNKLREFDIISDLHLIAANFIGQEKNFIESFKVIYEGIDTKKVKFNHFLLETLYPKPYLNELAKILKTSTLDPLVVLSLIRQESVFNPEATSRVGAKGLMQLMPTTAKKMRKVITKNKLSNPQINMELGTKYFHQLMKRYDNNLVYVLAAYNAGESRVERWKNTHFKTDSILNNIEAIPFLETRNYVKLIFRNIFFYKILHEPQRELANHHELNRIYNVDLGFKR